MMMMMMVVVVVVVASSMLSLLPVLMFGRYPAAVMVTRAPCSAARGYRYGGCALAELGFRNPQSRHEGLRLVRAMAAKPGTLDMQILCSTFALRSNHPSHGGGLCQTAFLFMAVKFKSPILDPPA